MPRRRVLIVMSSLLPGGAERVSLDVASACIAADLEVHLFIARFSKKAPAVYEVPCGAVVHKFYFNFDTFIVRQAVNFIRLCSVMSAVQPEWVISLGAQYRIMKLCGVFASTNTILSERNYPMSYSTKMRDCLQSYYSLASKVVFQTHEASSCYKLSSNVEISIIPNSVRPLLPAWEGAQSKNFCFVGRLDTQKNPEMLIKGFALFLSGHPDYKLDIYGDGPLKSKLELLAKALGCEHAVIFHGRVSDVHDRMKSALAYLSTSNYEGISNSMLEAMGMGMPCICTDCLGGSARMAFGEECPTSLVPIDDEVSLSRAMSAIADDRLFAQNISQMLLKASEKFDAEAIYSSWLSLIC